MTIEVVPEDIRLASARMADVVEEVRNAKPADGLKDLRGSLPGSMSADAASALIETWTNRFANWADDADEHREDLETAAISYKEADERAALGAEALRRSLGLPPQFSPVQPDITPPGIPGLPGTP
jgi:hypothetical protein